MTRYLVVAGLFVLSLITYIDRAAISSVKDPLAAELQLDDRAIGSIFSAFALGYAAAQIPSGWLADKLGPRIMLSAVVLLWSLLTAATGWVGGFASLWLVRFLFGIAEAGAFPGAARAFYNWLPASERGRANGIMFSGSRLGAAGAFPIMAMLLASGGWRQTFHWLALPGVVWALLWLLLFRDRPEGAARVEQAVAGEPGLSVGQALRTTAMRCAMVQYFGANFTTFLCLSWMNPYLKQRYALSTEAAAFYTMAILLVAATAQWATGFLVDRLYAVPGRRAISRSAPAMLGFAISAAGAAAIPFAPSPALAALCFSFAAFGVEMTISPSWAFCVDLGGGNSGAVSGAMNMAGNFGSFVSANAFPWLQSIFGGAGAYFALVCLLNLTGIACWTRMRGSKLAL